MTRWTNENILRHLENDEVLERAFRIMGALYEETDCRGQFDNSGDFIVWEAEDAIQLYPIYQKAKLSTSDLTTVRRLLMKYINSLVEIANNPSKETAKTKAYKEALNEQIIEAKGSGASRSDRIQPGRDSGSTQLSFF